MRKDGRYQALAEGIVESIINSSGGNAEPTGTCPVNVDIGLHTLILSVACDIKQLRHTTKAFHNFWHPEGEFIGIGILHAELILGTADAILNRQILHRLHVSGDATQFIKLRLQATNNAAGIRVALVLGLQINKHAATVERDIGAINTNERGQARNGRIGQYRVGHGLLPLSHGNEGNRLWRLGDCLNDAGILNREETFGYENIEQHGQRKRAEGNQQGCSLVIKHPVEQDAVTGNYLVEKGTATAVEATLLFSRRVVQQMRAHHRRQRQRHHGGNQDGYCQGNGELAEQPTDDVAHEKQRNQYCDQRESQGNDGESDLFGPFQRRLQGWLASFDIARDIFDHDDGIVDNETGGDGQRHQGQVVDGKSAQIHDAKGANQ